MEENTEKKVSRKKIIILSSLFGVFVIGAGVAFSIAFINISSKKPGWYTIEVDKDEFVKGHESLFSFNYYLDGKSNTIKANLENIKNIYQDTLKVDFANFNETLTYEAYPSIALINNALGSDVKVSPKIYEALKSAYDYSLIDNNYSIFAGPLYSYWDKICSYDNPSVEDPLYNAENAKILDDLVALINDTSNYQITFKNDNVINVSISDAYDAFLKANNMQNNVVSLNVLKNAYILKDIISDLNINGYKYGYLSDDFGLNVSLGDMKGLDFYLYDYISPNIYYYGKRSFSGEYILSSNRRFPLSSRNVESYIISKDGKTTFRSYNLDLKTGYPDNAFSNINVFDEGLDVVSVTLINNSLSSIHSKEELDEFIISSDYDFVYTLNDDEKKTYVKGNADLVIFDEIGYTPVTIGG